MIQMSFLLRVLACTVVVAIVTGCGDLAAPPAQSNNAKPNGAPSTTKDAHDHGHPSEGPHGGALIELGNEEYHVELVHDEQAGTVTIYILDAAAKAPVAIAASDVALNLKHEGQGKQFKLGASPNQGDPQGKSSRFVSSDKELAEELDHEHGDAQLVVTVNGKQFRAKIEHHHEDDGHDHGDHKHLKG